MLHKTWAALALVAVIWISPHGRSNVQSQEPQAGSPRTVAKVDGDEISFGSVRRLVKKSIPNLSSALQRDPLIDAAVAMLVDRRVIYQYLVEQKLGAGKNEVRLELERFKSELEKIEQTIDGYLLQTEQYPEELNFEIAWRIAWNRYLKKRLTDEFMQSHFEKHRREFDGTELRVAHLLIKSNQQRSAEESIARASEILSSITNQELTWSAAVQTHSDAPSKDTGGEIGWIQFNKPMPASFSEAAFALELNEVSPPVQTSFGVHLIKCLEIRAGKIGWRDAADQVREHASRSLFQQIAEEHRSESTIELFPASAQDSDFDALK